MNWSIERLWHRMLLVIGRGRSTGIYDDTGNVQTNQVQFSDLETHGTLRRLAEYGFASALPENSDCVAVFVGGDRSNGVIIATGHQASRLKGLKAGEVGLYDDLGRSIVLGRDGITVEGGSSQVTVRTLGNVGVNGIEVQVTALSKFGVDAGENVEINAGVQAAIHAPQLNILAPAGVIVTTPLAQFSGVVDAAGGFLISGNPAW